MAKRGDIVYIPDLHRYGVVVHFDRDNALEGGVMNNLVSAFDEGKIHSTLWYEDGELEVMPIDWVPEELEA